MALRKRRYDATLRRKQANRTRAQVLEAARCEFLERGYAATTVRQIARAAGVSVETIYKIFGGKPGLVRALWERGLAGRGATPAPARSDAMSSRERDGRAIALRWGELVAEVAPMVSPILLLVRAGASTDHELAALLRESDEQRLARMRHNARKLASRGFLRKGVSVERAAEIMWACASPELYDLFVVRRGWSPRSLGRFVADTIAAILVTPRGASGAARGRRAGPRRAGRPKPPTRGRASRRR